MARMKLAEMAENRAAYPTERHINIMQKACRRTGIKDARRVLGRWVFLSW